MGPVPRGTIELASAIQSESGAVSSGSRPDAAAAAPTGLARLATPVSLLMLGLLTLPFLALFFRWFMIQHKLSWAYKEDWGHAYLVPLISFYLLYQRRKEIARATPRVFWPGLPAVLLGIMSYALFTVNQALYFHMGQGFAIVLTIFGAVLTLFGPQVMRWAFLPIAFLVFGVTVSESIMIQVTFKLQEIAAEGSYVMLSIIGLFAGYRTEIGGTTLEIVTSSGESYPLNVAEACSGMRMVVAFIALSVAVAIVGCRMWWQRIATMALALPVALLMNMVRVTTLGVLTLIDPDLAAGDAHTVIGTILLLPSLAAFLGVVWILNRLVADENEAAVETVAVKKVRKAPAKSDPNKVVKRRKPAAQKTGDAS